MTNFYYNCYKCEKDVIAAVARIYAHHGIIINLVCPQCGSVTKYDTRNEERSLTDLF